MATLLLITSDSRLLVKPGVRLKIRDDRPALTWRLKAQRPQWILSSHRPQWKMEQLPPRLVLQSKRPRWILSNHRPQWSRHNGIPPA